MAVIEKFKRTKTTVAAELPEELLRLEILTRLPIKSAVRFKCVCKSWLSLFSNPQFVKQHLTRNSTQNPNDYDCLVAQKHNKILIVSRYKETYALSSEDTGISLVGSVRGLVCLRHHNNLSLWNPAIHQSKEFTLLPSRCHDHIALMGFGFDPVTHNYKIVVLSTDLESSVVYDSNSDSWIVVSIPDNVYLQSRKCYFSTTITVVKDCPYWRLTTFARDGISKIGSAISLTLMKFDVGSNKFKLLPKFYFDTSLHGEGCNFQSEVVDMNDCLNLIVYDRNSSNCMLDIYSLEGEEECCVWSKTYTFGPLNFCRQHWWVIQGFYNGEIVLHDDGGMFSCYDQKTDTIKNLSTTSTSTTASVMRCFRYTPSLVFLEGMKSVHLTNQTRRTTDLCCGFPQRLINSLND